MIPIVDWEFFTSKISKFNVEIQSQWSSRKMDIQLCDKHLIYSVLISSYWIVISEYSTLSKIFEQVNMNILDITAAHLNIATEYIRCL